MDYPRCVLPMIYTATYDTSHLYPSYIRVCVSIFILIRTKLSLTKAPLLPVFSLKCQITLKPANTGVQLQKLT